MSASRGLLLLDVDGVLNPALASRNWLDKNGYFPRQIPFGSRTFKVWLARKHGAQLLALAEETSLELVWATTWGHAANEKIAPLVGLPELPVIEFPTKFNGSTILGHQWKFGPVLTYAGDRPVAWFDDDFIRHDEEQEWFLAERGDTPTLLQTVDPTLGLVKNDFDAVRAWAVALGAHERTSRKV